MEEIDLNQLINYFKSKVVYIIFTMALAFFIAALYVYFVRVPEYTSSTTILLNQTNNQATINTSDLTLNKSLVPTYSEIIKSKRVLNQVIDNMALEYEYSALYSMISVSEVKDTSIIRISVTNEDRELAARIANEISNVFTREIVEIYNLENISVIDEAEVSQVSSNTSIVKIVLIATIAGGLIAAAAVFVIFYFDTTVKNEEDIERATGLPVIGLIPMPHEKVKKSYHKKYYQEIAKKHLSDTREAVVPIDVKPSDDTLVEQEIEIPSKVEEKVENKYVEVKAEDIVQKVLEGNNNNGNGGLEATINLVEKTNNTIPLQEEKVEEIKNTTPNDNGNGEKVVSANVTRRKKRKKKRKIQVN